MCHVIFNMHCINVIICTKVYITFSFDLITSLYLSTDDNNSHSSCYHSIKNKKNWQTHKIREVFTWEVSCFVSVKGVEAKTVRCNSECCPQPKRCFNSFSY